MALPTVCWDREQLVTAGFSRGNASIADFGVSRKITSIVYHDMEGYLAGAIATWNQGAASAHLCVLKNGTVVLTVRLEDVAWHAGTSSLTGRTEFWKTHNINPYSVGIEIEGYADARDGGYTQAQRDALRNVTDWLVSQYGIRREQGGDSLGGLHLHSEISNQRGDPGPTWDWSWVL